MGALLYSRSKWGWKISQWQTRGGLEAPFMAAVHEISCNIEPSILTNKSVLYIAELSLYCSMKANYYNNNNNTNILIYIYSAHHP